MEIIKTIATAILTSSVFLTLWELVARKIIENKIDTYYSKKLEEYKNHLNAITEIQRFQHNRWITDFTLYTNKKHRVYRKLYYLILIADGSIENIIGFREVPSFDDFGKEDMRKYLENYPVLNGIIEKLMDRWDENKKEAIKEIRQHLYVIDFHKADKARVDAKNYYLLNIMYLSDEVEKICTQLFSEMVTQFVVKRSEIIDHHFDEQSKNNCRRAKEEKDILLKQLKDNLRKELKVGYYTDENNA